MLLTRMLHTVRHLKAVQVYGRAYRPRPYITRLAPSRLRASHGVWTPAIARGNPQTGPRTFRFLNQERSIDGWSGSAIPKLWLYNLHYFEHPTHELIARWILENPMGMGIGWDAYPLSLRMCNWIKWHLSGNCLQTAAVDSLNLQAAYLSQSIEHHLLGNHLLANAKALIFAGIFLEGKAAGQWLTSGLQILLAQLKEQILSDGGHFERSPMYHSQILEDLLDLINLGRLYPGHLPDLSDTASHMIGWLRQMSHPDGRIAFFNDSAFNVAPDQHHLTAYAARLGINETPSRLNDSGYIRLDNGRASVFFDAAPIGPDYQPGHAHADTLSFELSVDGARAIVNSGTSTYENTTCRHRQRGTSAHNTVGVDGQDSSEVWSAFRVARRARPFRVQTDRRTFAEAAHDGYARLSDPVIHLRRVELEDNQLRIIDTLRAKRQHRAEVYFHLSPGSGIRIHLDPKLCRSDEDSFWYPEFYRSVPNRTVVGRCSTQGDTEFITRILF